jgi:hypothetical protein
MRQTSPVAERTMRSIFEAAIWRNMEPVYGARHGLIRARAPKARKLAAPGAQLAPASPVTGTLHFLERPVDSARESGIKRIY